MVENIQKKNINWEWQEGIPKPDFGVPVYEN